MAIPRRNRFRRHLKKWPLPKKQKDFNTWEFIQKAFCTIFSNKIKLSNDMNNLGLKPGEVFFSKYLINQGNRTDLTEGDFIPITVVSVDCFKNELEVDWDSGAGNETWNLEHCIWAFERGEYSYTKERLSK